MIKTTVEIQALKDSWLKDPIWDIEETEGFEEHKAELLEFHKEMEAKWQKDTIKRLEQKATFDANSNGH